MAKSAFRTNMSRASSQHSSVDGETGPLIREATLKNLPMTSSRPVPPRVPQVEGQTNLSFPVRTINNSDTPFTSTHTSPRM